LAKRAQLAAWCGASGDWELNNGERQFEQEMAG
jgi:hypothetical protein